MKNDNDEDKVALMSSLMAVPACQMQDANNDWFPAVDLAESREEYVFQVDLPGLNPEEVQFDVDNVGISITGKRLGPPSGRRLRVERPSGPFFRRLPMPSDTTGEVFGSFCDGVLELRIPKTHNENGGKQAKVDAQPGEPLSELVTC